MFEDRISKLPVLCAQKEKIKKNQPATLSRTTVGRPIILSFRQPGNFILSGGRADNSILSQKCDGAWESSPIGVMTPSLVRGSLFFINFLKGVDFTQKSETNSEERQPSPGLRARLFQRAQREGEIQGKHLRARASGRFAFDNKLTTWE